MQMKDRKLGVLLIALFSILFCLTACGEASSRTSESEGLFSVEARNGMKVVVDIDGEIDFNYSINAKGDIVDANNKVFIKAVNVIDYLQYYMTHREVFWERHRAEAEKEYQARVDKALAEIFSEDCLFSEIPTTDQLSLAADSYGATLDRIYSVTSAENKIGYAVIVSSNGLLGPIQMAVGIDLTERVMGVSSISNMETGGIGSRVMDNLPNAAGVPVLDQFIGMSGAGTLEVGKNVTAITGATVSTRGITAGVNAALAVIAVLLK